MIVADLKNIWRQIAPTPNMRKALDFLLRLPTENLPDARIDIDGDRVYALVQSYTTVPLSDPITFEVHRKYIDVLPIAEWCLTMMVMFERNFRRLLDNQRACVLDRDARFQSELRGRRVGIIGYGNIGRKVGRVCRCLGLELWAMDRTPIGPRLDRYAPPGTGDADGVL